ncbi:MAG TPA: hypothetical protein VGN14_05735 [Candidatus Elarobacter sp.]
MRTRFPIAAALLAVAVAACGGGGGGVTPSSTKTTPNNAQGTARGTASIFIPARTATASTKRMPSWVSPSTQSVTIQITRESDRVQTFFTAVTTPGSTLCASVTGGVQCQIPFGAPPGVDDIQIYAMDGPDPGTALELASYVKNGVTFTAQADNSMTFTLGGIFASFPLTMPAPAFTAGTPSDYTIAFTAADIDGNAITGPLDAPFCVVVVNGGSGSAFTLKTPAAGAAGISSVPCVIPSNTTAGATQPTTQAGLGILDGSQVSSIVVHYDGTAGATGALYVGTQSFDTRAMIGMYWQSVTL